MAPLKPGVPHPIYPVEGKCLFRLFDFVNRNGSWTQPVKPTVRSYGGGIGPRPGCDPRQEEPEESGCAQYVGVLTRSGDGSQRYAQVSSALIGRLEISKCHASWTWGLDSMTAGARRPTG